MVISERRFPTSPESQRVFTFVSIPIHIWAWIAILRVVPSWILSMGAIEMAGVMAYPLAFALLESVLIFSGLWLLAVVLPYRLYRARFVSQSVMILLPVLVWAVVMQLWGSGLSFRAVSILLEILIVVLAVISLCLLVIRETRIQKALETAADRLLVMGIFYSLIGVISLLVVVLKNIL